MCGPRTCEISSTVELNVVRPMLSNVTGSINRRNNPKRGRDFPVKESSFKLRSGISSVDPSASSGMAVSNRTSWRRLGFEVRIENSWDVVGVCGGEDSLTRSDRAVRSVILDARGPTTRFESSQ